VDAVLTVGGHVDVCDPMLVALRALLELRDEMSDLVELQRSPSRRMGSSASRMARY
jgi:hypothetical protein